MLKLNNLCRGYIIIPAFLFLFGLKLFAENPDTTLVKIKNHVELIKSASQKFKFDYKILFAVIYVERTLNYTWEDKALDDLLAEAGLNSSIGFCQVKMKTAYWIEVQLNKDISDFYCGEKYKNILNISHSPKEIIEKLDNDSLNILYATAYIRIMMNRWQKLGYPINDKPEIIGTLYSTGLFYKDGSERNPNSNPKANEFGEKVKIAIRLFPEF